MSSPYKESIVSVIGATRVILPDTFITQNSRIMFPTTYEHSAIYRANNNKKYQSLTKVKEKYARNVFISAEDFLFQTKLCLKFVRLLFCAKCM